MHKRFAVFIDGDNISWKEYETVLSLVKNYGEIAEMRVYGDWTQSYMNGWKEILERNPAFLYQAFRGKDATDYRIIMDAVEMAIQNPPINAFCIASSDAGYRYLVYNLRSRGKYTLGIGKKLASPEWREACDDFRLLENGKSADETEPAGVETGEIISEGILGYGFNFGKADKDGWILLADFCNIIKEHCPTFSWKPYGEKSIDALEKFAAAYPDTIEFDKTRTDSYRIRRNPAPLAVIIGEGTGVIQKIAGNFGFIESANGIFYFRLEDVTDVPTGEPAPAIAEGDAACFKITKMPDPEKKTPEESNGKAVEVRINKTGETGLPDDAGAL